MKYRVVTYGCQMNERDSDAVGALLRRFGHEPAPDEAAAEILVVNTCSVRGKAEDKAIGKLVLLVRGKRAKPGRVVGAMGCMVQRLGKTIFERVRGLDFAIGTHALSRMPQAIDLVREGRGPVLDCAEEGEDYDLLTGHSDGQISAFVNILLGCDRRCAYCVVPHVRGKEWSRPAEGVIAEVRRLVATGVREVTLLGQSVMSYGRSNPVWPAAHASPRGFSEPLPRLLEALDGMPGLARVRFTSGHPSGCSDELVRAMAELPCVCEHLHMPCQSGSDRILKLMRRGYTVDDVRRAVGRLRAAVPDVALTTDIIVGFPTETEADFESTVRFMDEIGFDNSFIFKYSPRPGTPAAAMVDDVPDDAKRLRNKVLLAQQDRVGLQINRGMVGRIVDVLVEGTSLRNPATWAGRTRGNTIVVFDPPAAVRPGDCITVKIERARPQTLYGKAEG